MRKLKILELRPSSIHLAHTGDREDHRLCSGNEFTKGLKACGFDTTMAYLKGEKNEVAERRTAANRVIFLNNKKIKPFGKILPAAFKLRKTIKNGKFDVVIGHWLKQGMIVGLGTLFLPDISKYLVIRGPSGNHKFKRKLFTFIFLRRRFTFITVSEAMREYFIKINWGISPDRVITLHNTVDIKAMEKNYLPRRQARDKFGLREEEVAFVTVGRLTSWKGHLVILKALELLGDETPHLKMVIIGTGKLKDFLKQETKKRKLENRVIFTGGVPDAYQYLPGFDAFILSSVREPFSVALLEAMAAKLPVIACDAGGSPEAVGDSGLLVPPEDPRALAEAIKTYYLKSDQERRDFGIKAYNRLCRYFSHEVYRKKLCSIIH